jgi:integrase
MTENLIRRQRRKTMTDLMVKNLPKKRKRYILADPEQRGLYIRVPPQGPAVFAAVARNPASEQKWATIGSADTLGIEQARDKAREAIRRIRDGLEPFEAPPVKPDAFQNVAEEWLKRHVAKKKLRTQAEIERRLAKYVLPHWANREFTSLRRSDIAALLDRIEDEHGPRQADTVLGDLRSIGNWYSARHDEYVPPFVRGMSRVDGKAAKRSRTLSDEELRAVWKAAEGSGTYGALVKFLLLTAQRRGACLAARWSDVDANGVWEIRSEEREKGNAGTLKLPAQALAVIQALPRFSTNPFVFASAKTDGPLNGFGRPKEAFDKHCGVTGWTLHDLRRTARSLMSRAGVNSDHAERVLGHVIRGVEGIYDRHQYATEKADALRRLASLIDEIVNGTPSKVIRMKGRRAAR